MGLDLLTSGLGVLDLETEMMGADEILAPGGMRRP